ncbi:tRNA (adenosine(37)-N6)-threonylcarbamoyltransferase complex dimerization subunit type 1 TsaB [Actinoalloteichus hymeniacidonis]|uniref:tRNA threonylcarbamoyl adenosine modification protein n=1 Tax=Actinoalloteichus hymeniacidonis TaxID=340345 RepID=A0AAC9N0M0_9PSEU|nr:tRNA (adenosine(37)-N6)-threonylcarbamoyltransferase complex dimerization subunit type 1 TsaB [Actinoalloteichus hymeniacidonis]AOS65744.1 tRNA threonylcarbamoyl adenosine modification protein [Actinoalloteichus hymeniacidonis]MBB5906166.1 tRNA threonylcarbamoyl adenosine modification protein YeaZ [Actinoalloteichus hymeniacidonis]
MLLLAIDTATPSVSAGLIEVTEAAAPRLLAERIVVDPRAHGELLTPLVRSAVESAGRALGDIDAIAAGVGPGPFTGLRVGMVTAAALGDALDRPVYPVCSLDAARAAAVEDGTQPGPLLVVSDARRRELYWARYDTSGARTHGPEVATPAALAERLPELDVAAVAGPMASTHAPLFELPVHSEVGPTPLGLARVIAAAALERGEPRPLVPLYLRRPDAVAPGAPKRVTT